MAPSRNRKKYESWPKIIFGLKCSQHRALKMRPVARYYRKSPYGRKANKEALLTRLAELEEEKSRAEVEIIRSYFSTNRMAAQSLCDQLDVARGFYDGAECCVCMESFPVHVFPQMTSICRHEPRVCRDCITESVNTQIPDVNWDKIRCPECPEALPFDVVKQWASEPSFQTYDRKALMSVFKGMPNFTMCLGPNCDSGQIHDGEDDQPIMTCEVCKFKTCYTHKMPWHVEQTCDQYDEEWKERKEQEAASEEFITKTSKACANPACGARITKNGGCNHMTCTKCDYEFCFVCFAPWKMIMAVGNIAHALDCKHHSDNLPEMGYYEEESEFEDEEI